MRNRKTIGLSILTVLMFMTTSTLWAQGSVGSHALWFGWGVITPVGATNFTDQTSFVAPQLGYHYRLSSRFAAGVSLGVSYSDQKGVTTDRFQGDLVTADTHRTLTLVPVQVRLGYFPLGDKATRFCPYVGVAGGAQYARFYMTGEAIVSAKTSNWAAVFTPYLGVR